MEIQRLAALAAVWGTVKLFHPRLAAERFDWDGPLVRAVPKVRTAADDAAFAAAVGEMLATLGDPATGIEPPQEARATTVSSTPAPSPAAASITHRRDSDVLIVNLRAVKDRLENQDWSAIQAVREEIETSTRIVIDFRMGEDTIGSPWTALQQLAPVLVWRDLSGPATRTVVWSGWPPQTGYSSGGYYRGFEQIAVERFAAKQKGGPPRRVVFVVDDKGGVPALAWAMQLSKDGAIVAAGPIRDSSDTRTHALPGGFRAVVRVNESLWGPLRANTTVPEGKDPIPVAVKLARARVKPAKQWEKNVPSPPAIASDDEPYEGMTYPAVEYRLLALFRLWTVIDRFYPYKHLIGDWSAVLPEFIPRVIAAKDEREWALTLAELAARIADGHTHLSGSAVLDALLGVAPAPVETRLVEGLPAVTRLRDAQAARDAGFRVGDVIVAVDREPAQAIMQRRAPYVPASTTAAHAQLLAEGLLPGPAGSSARVTVKGADGVQREITALRDFRFYDSSRSAEKRPWHLITPQVGYVDLTQLTSKQVPAMFEDLRQIKALIFDMRGYPHGTAWDIAPRINVKNATVGAQFRRAYHLGVTRVEERSQRILFEQRLPQGTGWIYTGRTVTLIDDRAISQAEHSCLFFEAASGTTFIGTPTAGANGDVTNVRLPGGLTLRFTGHDVRHADGRQLQRVGIQPHVVAAPTLAGVRAGKDEVLDRAVEWLETGE
ncbi:S41 family peptidase [Sorangium sp. So ce375]|uniref:S41 family peptidase n=1 Tax=Sorangium sp. So ce375 TaxID=3133306 RepID=UPI003F5B5791